MVCFMGKPLPLIVWQVAVAAAVMFMAGATLAAGYRAIRHRRRPDLSPTTDSPDVASNRGSWQDFHLAIVIAAFLFTMVAFTLLAMLIMQTFM
jgi:hypothetical protein